MSLPGTGNSQRMPFNPTPGGSAHPENPEEGLVARPFELFAGFSTDEKHVREVEELLLCLRCGVVPDPSYYFICDICDRILCGRCAYRQVEGEQDEGGISIATCCSNQAAPTKGSERFLKTLLQNSYWDCVNKGGGCDVPVRGFDWEEHVKSCKPKFRFRCYYSDCGFKCFSKEDIIGHYITAHGGSELVPAPNGLVLLTIPFDETALEGRNLALMKFRGRHFLFGGEVVGADLHLWVWDMEAVSGGNGTMKCVLKLRPAGDQKDGELRYSAKCVPYDVPPERIVEDGHSFPVGLGQLRKKYLLASSADHLKYWKVGIIVKAKGSPEGDEGVE